MPHRRPLALFPDAAAHAAQVPWLHASGADTLVDVLVVSAAERTRVVGVAERRLKVSVEAEAGPAANEALVRYVTRLLGVARAQVSIVGGVPVSRRKTLRLAGVATTRARFRLHPHSPLYA